MVNTCFCYGKQCKTALYTHQLTKHSDTRGLVSTVGIILVICVCCVDITTAVEQ